MNNKDIEELAEKYKLEPYNSIKKINGEYESFYLFLNSPYDLEVLRDDELYKKINLSLTELAYRLYNIYQIKYSQQEEFIID
jgi:hypothetical protein